MHRQISADLSEKGQYIIDQIEIALALQTTHRVESPYLVNTINNFFDNEDVVKITIQRNGKQAIFENPAPKTKRNLDRKISSLVFDGEHGKVQLHRNLAANNTQPAIDVSIELMPIDTGRYLIYFVLSSIFFLLLFSSTIIYINIRATQRKQSAVADDSYNSAESDLQNSVLSILVVDDNDVSRKIIKVYLDTLGHDITLAGSGKDAIATLEKSKFDLILMDLHMPGLNGAETVQRIRKLSDIYRQIPIIGLSADNNPASLQSALAAGMDEFLTKPINQSDLVNILKRWQSKSTTQHQINQINSNDIASLRNMLISELPGYRIALQEAQQHGNHDYLYQTAHKIAGGSVYCEIPTLEEAARALQTVVQSNDDHLIAERTDYLIKTIDSTLNEYGKL